jgi:hypothetical protein
MGTMVCPEKARSSRRRWGSRGKDNNGKVRAVRAWWEGLWGSGGVGRWGDGVVKTDDIGKVWSSVGAMVRSGRRVWWHNGCGWWQRRRDTGDNEWGRGDTCKVREVQTTVGEVWIVRVCQEQQRGQEATGVAGWRGTERCFSRSNARAMLLVYIIWWSRSIFFLVDKSYVYT